MSGERTTRVGEFERAFTAALLAGDQIAKTRRERPTAQFVVGGRGLTSVARSHAGVGICERVSEVVEAVHASVMRAGLN